MAKFDKELALRALRGEIDGLRVIGYGDGLYLINAKKGLVYDGFRPEHEQFKGVVLRVGKDITLAEPDDIEVVSWCLPKFYNLGEKKEKDAETMKLIDSGATVVFMEKKDGTNVRPFGKTFSTRNMLEGGVDEDSESSFIHFGKAASEIASEKYPILLDDAFQDRWSTVFELIHPDNKIISDYGDDRDLYLVACYDKVAERELTYAELVAFAKEHGLTVVPSLSVSGNSFDQHLESLLEQFKGTTEEGSVLQIEHGGEVIGRIKFKNPEYLALMRMTYFATLGRTKDIIFENNCVGKSDLRRVLHESNPDIPEEIFEAYENHYDKWMETVEAARNEWAEALALAKTMPSDRKGTAILLKSNPETEKYIPHVMAINFGNKETGWLNMLKKNGALPDSFTKMNSYFGSFLGRVPDRGIVLMVGIQGSGKSTVSNSMFPSGTVVSADDVKAELGDMELQQKWQEIERRVVASVKKNGIGVLDATSRGKKERRKYIEIARKLGVPINAIMVNPGVETSITQNGLRSRHVPDDIILWYAKTLQVPTTLEGFDSVAYYVRDGESLSDLYPAITKNFVANPESFLRGTAADVLLKKIPELARMVSFEQENRYHTQDLFNHTISVASAFSGNQILALSALLHDAGKASPGIKQFHGKVLSDQYGLKIGSRVLIEDISNSDDALLVRPIAPSLRLGEPIEIKRADLEISTSAHYYGHERLSAQIAISVLARLGFDQTTIETVAGYIIQNHMILTTGNESSIIKMVSDGQITTEHAEILRLLATSDIEGHGSDAKPDNDISIG